MSEPKTLISQQPTDQKGALPASKLLSVFFALDEQDPLPAHFKIVRYALAKENALPTAAAVDALARTLLLTLPQAYFQLGLDQATLGSYLLPVLEEGVVWLDERAAQYLEKEFLAKDEASEVRNRSRARAIEWQAGLDAEQEASFDDTIGPPKDLLWRLWLDESLTKEELPTLRFALLLTRVLWHYRVGPRLEREWKYKAAATPRRVLDLTTRALHSGHKEIREEEKELLLYSTKSGRTLARIEKEDLAALAHRPFAPMVDRDIATKLLAAKSLPGQRLLRFLVGQGFHQKLIEPIQDFRSIYVEGGLQELTRRLGMEPGRMSERLRDALDALSVVRLALPHGGHEALLQWSNRAAGPGHRAMTHIVLMDALLPGYVFAMPDRTDSERQARRLIPFPQLFPLMVGSPNLHAAQAVLQLVVLEEFSDRAQELMERESIVIDDKRWRELADRAEVPARLLPELKEAWKTGEGDKTPAFLSEPQKDCYQLSKAYENSQKLIEETGEITKKSRARGKASQRARRGSGKKKPK